MVNARANRDCSTDSPRARSARRACRGVTGFPITRLQMSVIRSGGIQEQPPAPARTLDGMPASPHQLAVIRRQQIAHKLKTDGTHL